MDMNTLGMGTLVISVYKICGAVLSRVQHKSSKYYTSLKKKFDINFVKCTNTILLFFHLYVHALQRININMLI